MKSAASFTACFTGSLVAVRCRGSRLENGSGGGENAGRALVGDLLGLEPVLDIPTAA
jgi:hypothetical protein